MRQTFRIAVRAFAPFESALRKQWAAFDEQMSTGLQLDLDVLDLRALQTALFEQSRTLTDEYDVVLVNTDWLAALFQDKRVLDLAPYLRSRPIVDFPYAWPPSLLHLQSIGDAIIGLPYHDGPECLIYRSDLFQDERTQHAYAAQYGSPLRVPETWEEFHRVARFFHRPDEGLWGTAFAGFPDGHNTVYDFMLQLWTRGSDLFDDHGRLRLHTPQAAEALVSYRSLMQDTLATHPGSLDFDSVRLGEAFADGEVAMMVNWFGFAAWAESSADSAVPGKIGVAAIPHAQESPTASLNIYWLLAIARGCPRPDLAYGFLRHCMSPAMDKLLTLEGAVGCRLSTWNDPDVLAIVPHFRHLESLHAHARELPRTAAWPAIAELIDRLVRSAATNGDTLDHLLQEADRKASALAADLL